MECMGVTSGCDYQEAGVASGSLVEYMGMFSRKWVWVESMGGLVGLVVKRHILLIPTLCICSSLAAAYRRITNLCD